MTFYLKYQLDENDYDIFDQLSSSVILESIVNGRVGGNIVDFKDNSSLIPIVRTTTVYNNPSQQMKPIHYELIDKIKKVTNIKNLEFNNALVEMYDMQYRNMGFHTDQSLDLEDDSYICIFSCYKNGYDPSSQRKLVIQNKTNNLISTIN